MKYVEVACLTVCTNVCLYCYRVVKVYFNSDFIFIFLVSDMNEVNVSHACYPLANEGANGYSNATVNPSFLP